MINRQVGITVIILVIVFLFFELTNIDILIQDYFFDFQSNQWVLDSDNYILKFILYDGIKKLFISFVLSILILLIFFRKKNFVKRYRKGLIIVCLSTILVPLAIGALKAITNIPCPKNLTHYNGQYPNVTVLSGYPADFNQHKKIRCYPAGHASGGFSLMSLFFLFLLRKNKIIALMSALTIGWSVGTYKILIGDHFLGHTVITMILSWLIILLIVAAIDKLFDKVTVPNYNV